MTLDFGFGMYSTDENVKKAMTEKFDALDEKQKQVYLELPFLLMCCDISHISEKTIPIVLHRARLQGITSLPIRLPFKPMNCEQQALAVKTLQPFIGFMANVANLGHKEFLQQKFRSDQYNDSAAQLDKDKHDIVLGKHIKKKKSKTTKKVN